ncbi:hypothetical protein [Sphingomonas pokkalii]
MRLVRWMTGLGVGALCVAGLAVSPALQAQERDRLARAAVRTIPLSLNGVGGFTPAAADPKLAAALARSGISDSGFRFTPADSRSGVDRPLTVAVRARSNRAVDVDSRIAAAKPSAVNLTPIAYNLGVSVGWRRVALSGDVTHVDLVDQPGSRERKEVGLSYSGKRLSGRISAAEDRPLVDTPVLIGDKSSYALDLSSSYSVSRNLALTAGVRYKNERDRLPQLTNDSRRESQAIYIGTAFRF